MSKDSTAGSPVKYAVYGLGGMGKRVVDSLLNANRAIAFIMDKGFQEKTYKGIEVLSIDEAAGPI